MFWNKKRFTGPCVLMNEIGQVVVYLQDDKLLGDYKIKKEDGTELNWTENITHLYPLDENKIMHPLYIKYEEIILSPKMKQLATELMYDKTSALIVQANPRVFDRISILSTCCLWTKIVNDRFDEIFQQQGATK